MGRITLPSSRLVEATFHQRDRELVYGILHSFFEVIGADVLLYLDLLGSRGQELNGARTA